MDTNKFVELLISNGFATSENISGCSLDEVEKLERHVGRPLPNTFREYLMALGHSAGDLHKGSDFSYKSLFALTNETREILSTGPFKLPDNAFVFFSHQGYIFTYFILSEGDDPPVYVYMENEPGPKKWASNFSEYLSKSFEEALEARKSLKMWGELRKQKTQHRKS